MKNVLRSALCFAAVISFGGAAQADDLQPVPGSSESSTVFGVLKYRGGFAEQLSMEFASPTMVKSFTLRIPNFCRDLEILEAGTAVDNAIDIADQVSNNRSSFVVNHGAGLRVNAVWATLNGPVGVQCDIPVVAGPDVVDPDPNPDPTPSTGVEGLYFDRSDSRSWIDIKRGGVVATNIGLFNNQTGWISPLVLTTTLFSRPQMNRYDVYGYADLQVASPRGHVLCRANVRIEFQFYSGRSGGVAKLYFPAGAGIDAAGRCVVSTNEVFTTYDLIRSN